MTIEEIKNVVDVNSIENVAELKGMLATAEQAKTEKENTLESFIENLTDDEKMEIYNEYAEMANYEKAYNMFMFDEFFDGLKPSAIFEKVDTNNFDINDEYFWYDRWGTVVSGSVSDFIEEEFSASDICSWIERNDYDINSDGFFEWKDEYMELIDLIEEITDRIEELEEE